VAGVERSMSLVARPSEHVMGRVSASLSGLSISNVLGEVPLNFNRLEHFLLVR